MIFLIGIILMIIAFVTGETAVGAVGVLFAIAGFILSTASATHEDTKARANRRKHWANIDRNGKTN